MEVPLQQFSIDDSLERLSETVGALGRLSHTEPLTAEVVGAALVTLLDIRDQAESATRNYALEAVTTGHMTRKRAAEIIEVHPHTISRWLTARQVEQQQ